MIARPDPDMADGCPEGLYRDRKTGECRRSIEAGRKGTYGEGFLSEPQSEQFARIRREEGKETPQKVDEQMSALNAFQHSTAHHEAAERDLRYAESLNQERKDPPAGRPAMAGGERMAGRCGPGEEYVAPYDKDDGTHVEGHCRKKHDRLTAHDRRVDRKNGRKAAERRR